jgi:menaquinone-dependent protoporphyrinogen IX oxidase
MKTLVIYTSQTGFTKKYSEWLAERMSADILELKDAKKKDDSFFAGYDAIVYAGWCMAEKLVKSGWYFKMASAWKKKRLAVICVGGSPNDNPDIEGMLKNMMTDEQREYIKAFYCQGGFNYERMNAPSRLAMKMFVSALKKKKDPTEEEKIMTQMVATSYDISDEEYLEPIVDYLK